MFDSWIFLLTVDHSILTESPKTWVGISRSALNRFFSPFSHRSVSVASDNFVCSSVMCHYLAVSCVPLATLFPR